MAMLTCLCVVMTAITGLLAMLVSIQQGYLKANRRQLYALRIDLDLALQCKHDATRKHDREIETLKAALKLYADHENWGCSIVGLDSHTHGPNCCEDWWQGSDKNSSVSEHGWQLAESVLAAGGGA